MADIRKELVNILMGRYGVDIRDAIHDALQKINTEIEGDDEEDA